MPKFIDLSNQKFGRLTVISLHCKATKIGSKTLWNCLCNCGNPIKVRSDSLKNGHSQSCGCLCKEINSSLAKKRWTTHGKSKSKIFKIFCNMHRRCNDANYSPYRWYGALGIKVCERWKTFENFYADMGEPPTNKHSIDRINYNDHYKPTNCLWATQLEQTNHTRRSLYIKFDSQTKTLAQWTSELGLPYHTIWNRLYRLHWSVKRAFTF